MTMWMLVAVIMIDGQLRFMALTAHTSVAECYASREYFIATAPKPKINYEAICIKTDQLEVL